MQIKLNCTCLLFNGFIFTLLSAYQSHEVTSQIELIDNAQEH